MTFRAVVKMNFLKGFFLVALICGSTAVPTPEEDLSIYFNYANPEAKLVGGTQAAVGSHPHMVAFTTGLILRSFQCGGSIISNKHILTAAHCISAWFSWGSLSSSLRATVGTNSWNNGGVSYTLSKNLTHPNYVSGTIKNDLGLVITKNNIQFSNLIQPISLSFDFVGADVPVLVAGWGRIKAGGALAPNLLEIKTSTLEGQDCAAKAHAVLVANNYKNPPIVEPHIEICTFHSAGVGNCNGDSGSALVRIDNGQQIGIVSWGIPCAVGGPDMFARVSAYQDWLLNALV